MENKASVQTAAGSDAPPKATGGGKRLTAVTAMALVGASLLGIAAWKSQPSPRITPTHVLMNGSGGRNELLISVDADYEESSSWHGVGIEGGACEIHTNCDGAHCPVLRAAVLRPRQVGTGRISIDAVVTELYPSRVRPALEFGGAVECSLSAYVDVFRMGWRIERALQWRIGSSGAKTSVSVKPQGVEPGMQNGTVHVKASHVMRVELERGSALGDLVRNVPVTLRANFGYAEAEEQALRGDVVVDTELNVTSDGEAGGVTVEVPFATTASASLKSLAKYAAAPLRAGPASRHTVVFAAAPDAAATATLFGNAHRIDWHREVSFSERPHAARRLGGLRLPAVSDFKIEQRLQIDEATFFKVLLSLTKQESGLSEFLVYVASGPAWEDGSMTEIVKFSMLTNFSEPMLSMGGENVMGGEDVSEGAPTEFPTPLGNISISASGGSDLIHYTGDGGMSVKLTSSSESTNIDASLPPLGMAANMDLTSDKIVGSLKSTESGETIGSVDVASVPVAANSEDQKMQGTVSVAGETWGVVLDIKKSELVEVGNTITGSLTDKASGKTLGAVDAKFEVLASGDTSSHLKVNLDAEPKPVIDFNFNLDAVEPTCGKIVTDLSLGGEMLFSADLGCERKPNPDDLVGYAKVKLDQSNPLPLVDFTVTAEEVVRDCALFRSALTMDGKFVFSTDFGCKRSPKDDLAAHARLTFNETAPPLVNATFGWDTDLVWGGKLAGALELEGKLLARAALVAKEVGDLRTVGVHYHTQNSISDVSGVTLEFTKPGAIDVAVSGSLALEGKLLGSGEIKGTALDHAVKIGDVESRRELMFANPGAWDVKVSFPDEESGKLVQAIAIKGTLVQVGNIVTLEAGAPEMLTVTLALDSSDAGTMDIKTDVSAYDAEAKKSVSMATFGGKFVHSGDFSDGTLTLGAGGESLFSLPVRVSRGFVRQGDNYRLSGSTTNLNLTDILGPGASADCSGFVETYPDWNISGVGWDVALSDKGGKTFQNTADILYAYPPPPPETVAGSMTIEVEGDVAAFVADPAVKRSFSVAIADSVGVDAGDVEVTLTATRRLSEEVRRLAGSVKVDYTITLPQDRKATDVAGTLAAMPAADMAAALDAAMKKETGGESPYSMTIKEMSAPVVTKSDGTVEVVEPEPTEAPDSGAAGDTLTRSALLLVIAGTFLAGASA